MDEVVTRIVENLQIFVDDIHIRYEDTVSSPKPFSFGITLEGAHFQSADDNWVPTTTFETGRPVINKVSARDKIYLITKIITLNNLAIYLDTRGQYAMPLTGWDDISQLIGLMNAMVRPF